MTDLAAVRELMRGAAQSFKTLHATHRVWRDNIVVRERTRRVAQVNREKGLWVHPPFAQGRRTSPEPAVHEYRASLWVSRPSKYRLEGEEDLLVIDGDQSWESHPRRQFFVTQKDQLAVRGKLELSRVAFLLDPSPFARIDGLTVAGSQAAGRAAVRVKSPSPVEPGSLLFPGVGWAGLSPEYELWVDVERGVLLRTVERFEGADLAVAELLDVEFDLAIADDVFAPVLPAGRDFQKWEDIAPRELSLEEAARVAPFTVYIPENVPEGAGTPDDDVLFIPSPASVVTSYTDPERIPQIRLLVSETEAGKLEEEEDLIGYVPIEREGQALLVRSEQSDDGDWHSVALERDGTQILIKAMLDREAAIAVALSLKPVPRS